MASVEDNGLALVVLALLAHRLLNPRKDLLSAASALRTALEGLIDLVGLALRGPPVLLWAGPLWAQTQCGPSGPSWA